MYFYGNLGSYRKRAERALGKPLPAGTVIHHHNYKGNDSQLVICQDRAYHRLLHARMRTLHPPKRRRKRNGKNKAMTIRFAPSEIRLIRTAARLTNHTVASFLRTFGTHEALGVIARSQHDDKNDRVQS